MLEQSETYFCRSLKSHLQVELVSWRFCHYFWIDLARGCLIWLQYQMQRLIQNVTKRTKSRRELHYFLHEFLGTFNPLMLWFLTHSWCFRYKIVLFGFVNNINECQYSVQYGVWWVGTLAREWNLRIFYDCIRLLGGSSPKMAWNLHVERHFYFLSYLSTCHYVHMLITT